MFLLQLSDHINSQYYINTILFYPKMSNSIFSKRTSPSHRRIVCSDQLKRFAHHRHHLLFSFKSQSKVFLSKMNEWMDEWMNGRIFPFRSEKNFTWINTWGYFVNEIITFHLDCILIQSENLANFNFFLYFSSLWITVYF